MGRKEEYKLQNEQYLEALRAEEEIKELPCGILYRVLESGNGDNTPRLNSIVTVHYKGTLINGREFDNSWKRNCPEAFRLNQVIEGWQIALQRMHVGDHWIVYIPYTMGYGTRVYIVSGATGGFDVLRTASLMGNATAKFFNEKGPNALKGTAVYDEALQTEQRVVFSGNATEAIAMFPTKVNVAVAASLASVGPENMQMSMQSTPGFVGDTQRVEIKNEQVIESEEYNR